MTMRTPLSKVRGLGSAKDGTDTFWRQRITAVALVPLFIFFIVFLIAHAGAPYEDVVGSLSNPFIAALLGAMVIAALLHMRIGMQVIVVELMPQLLTGVDKDVQVRLRAPSMFRSRGHERGPSSTWTSRRFSPICRNWSRNWKRNRL